MKIDAKKHGSYTETGGGGVSDAHILIIPDWIYLSTAFEYNKNAECKFFTLGSHSSFVAKTINLTILSN